MILGNYLEIDLPIVIKIYLENDQVFEPRHILEIWKQIVYGYESDREIIFVLKVPSGKKYCTEKSYISVKQYLITNQSQLFSRILKVIKCVKHGIENNCITTIRDIYYQDVVLFHKNQSNAKKVLNLIASSLNTTPDTGFKVVPSQKGLAYGDLILQKPSYVGDAKILDFREPALIPIIFDYEVHEFDVLSGVIEAIIIVEKEAIFRSLCDALQKYPTEHKLLVLTGKGYPCNLTKRLIKLVSKIFFQAPILAFVDSDIYGIQICANYRYNSILPRLDSPFECRVDYAGVFLTEYEQGWMDINAEEWKLMKKFLIERNNLAHKDKIEFKFHREITRSMVLKKKCEMNLMNKAFVDYIINKVKRELRFNKRLFTAEFMDDFTNENSLFSSKNYSTDNTQVTFDEILGIK